MAKRLWFISLNDCSDWFEKYVSQKKKQGWLFAKTIAVAGLDSLGTEVRVP